MLVKDDLGRVWDRGGECCRCGECCQSGYSPQPMPERIPGACPLFRWTVDGLGACGDRRHPLYLNGCNVWPTHPEQTALYPSCSYSWRRVS